MSSYLSAQNIGIACGAGLLAYCIYFDNKRRNAPDYRERVTAKRQRDREAKDKANEIVLPPPTDKKACEKFFVKQLELGDELMQAGQVDRAVERFAYAIVYCPQSESMLGYLKQVIPPSALPRLQEYMLIASKRLSDVSGMTSKMNMNLEEEEVE